MSSGFISGGTIDNETERDDEWKRAAQELEDQRRAREDAAKHENDGKTLFQILQENKDKKQAEFEEKARFHLHNALNDDEADYLDTIQEKKRQEEANVKKDESAQISAFRRQQEEAEKQALEEESREKPLEDSGQWATTGRKRKKGIDSSLLKGIKFRKSNGIMEEKKDITYIQNGERANKTVSSKSVAATADKSDPKALKATKSSSIPQLSEPVSLALGYASSDED